MTNRRVEFPEQWDKSNDYSFKTYDKCKKEYKYGQEDELNDAFKPALFFHIFCISVITYSVISLIFILIRKDLYKKTKCNVNMSILFSIGTILNVSNLYIQDANFYHFPCFVSPFVMTIAFPINIFACAGNTIIYLKQCYANASLYEKENKDVKEKYEKRSNIIYKICLWFSERRIINTLLVYITMSLIYIIFTSLKEENYSMHPITFGHCHTSTEKIPEAILIFIFIFVFTPTVVNEIRKFRGNFSYGRTLSRSLILILISVATHMILSLSPVYYCRKINRYIPTDFYLVLMFLIFSLFQITLPILEAFILTKRVDDLEINKKGLLKVFENDILYKEFFDFAVKKRSVEYATFHIEYLEFKKIFTDNKSFLDEISSAPVTVPGPNPTNPKDKKLVELFTEIYSKADEIFAKYFSEESELELNLPAKLVKKVSTGLYEYNINYNRYLVNGTEGHTVEYDLINCETIFDEVHEEALDSLFLNVYKAYAKETKQQFGLDPTVKSTRSLDIAEQV